MHNITDGNLEIIHLVRVESVTLQENHQISRQQQWDAFCYVLSGGCDLHTADGKTFVQQAGDVQYFPLHAKYTMDIHSCGFSYIVCDFTCANEPPRQYFSFRAKTPQKYEKLFQKLLTSFTSDDPFSKATSYSLLYQIYAQIIHDRNIFYLSAASRQTIDAACSYILTHLSDPALSAFQVAQHLRVSDGHLRRLFRQKFGIPTTKYIVEARMKKAERLLAIKGMKISEVAQKVGYNSSSYFCSVFHATMGITPVCYKKELFKSEYDERGIMMVQLEKEQLEILRPMFRQIRFYMGRSVLDGMMGQAYADDENHPEFAMLLVRHYCYLSGTISGCQLRQLVEQYGLQNRCIVPSDAIAPVLKEEFPELNVSQRYSMRKDTVFDRTKLAAMAKNAREGIVFLPIDGALARRIRYERFLTVTDDYENLGVGFCCMVEGKIVGVASSNIIYRGGIEVTIRVSDEYQRMGIATTLAAKLILTCLDRGLFVSWDAANPMSVGLAEKLGYVQEKPYDCFRFPAR